MFQLYEVMKYHRLSFYLTQKQATELKPYWIKAVFWLSWNVDFISDKTEVRFPNWLLFDL